MENPYLVPPQVESAQSRSWGEGFMYAYQGPAESTVTPADIQPEDADAFDEGVTAGQDAAINGVPLSTPCLDLHAEGPTIGHVAGEEGFEGIVWLKDLSHGVAGGVLGSVIFFINLSIALETFSDDPATRLSEAAAALQKQLQDLGYDGSIRLFLGAGVDMDVDGCQVLLTSIYRGVEDATSAAQALGRPNWFVASWRSDQSGGIQLEANS